MKNQKCVKQLTFGVSFNHMFKLLDIWGEIADDILYNNKYFSSDYFSKISQQYTTERSLYNPGSGNRLVITANNLVFTHNIEEDYENEYTLFKKRVKNYIVPEILSARSLVVRRLGMVYVSELTNEEIQKFVALYFKSSIQGISDFRFSKKEATKGGLLLTDNHDFINKIYSFGNLGDVMQGLSYDFQLHFSPIRQDVRDTIDDFMIKANENFSKDVFDCLREEK